MKPALGALAVVMLVCGSRAALAQDPPRGATEAIQGQDASAAGDPHVAATNPDGAVEQEFLELQGLLVQMRECFGASRKFCAPDPGSVLAARLALYPQRFGGDPRAAPQWPALQAAAQELLESVGDQGLPETGATQSVSSQMDRYVLLDLLGRFDEAQRILDDVDTWGADACIWCTAENTVVVFQRKSELAERRGDFGGALALLHEAALDASVISEPERGGIAGEDLLFARYGLLLLRTGHVEEGTLLLAALTTRFPKSVGPEVARSELARRGALDGAERARLLTVNFNGGDPCTGFAVVAVYRDDDAASMRWIAVHIPAHREREHHEEDCTRTAAFDAEAFEELGRDLAPTFDECRRLNASDALMLMQGLAAGAKPFVGRCLDVFAADEQAPARQAQLAGFDKALRWLYGGGPDFADGPDSAPPNSNRTFAAAWRAWLAAR